MSQVQINRSDVALYVPASLLVGVMFYNSTDNKLYVGDPNNLPILVSDNPVVVQAQMDALEATNVSQASQIAALESESRATTVSATVPTSPESGDLWFDTSVGQLKIYTTEWVQANKVDLLTSGVTGVYPVTVDEFFDHIVFTPESTGDGNLSSEELQGLAMIATATSWAEQYTGRFFIQRTVSHYFDNFPTMSGGAKRPLTVMGGVASAILGVTYSDSAYVSQTITANNYRQIDKNAKTHIYPAMGSQWPTDVASGEPDVINVTYTVGTLPDAVPPSIKSAILLIAASLWEHRENEIVGTNIKSLKPVIAAKDLLHPYKLR